MTTLSNQNANTASLSNAVSRIPAIYGVGIYGVAIYGAIFQGLLTTQTANTASLTNQTAN